MNTLAISKVGKIGTGIMGCNVAWACAVNGLETYLYDLSPEQVRQAIDKLNGWFLDGSLTEEQANAASSRLHPCSSLEEVVAHVDLAFESVYEDLEIKKKVHAELGRIAPPHVLIGSNTSSLLCTPLAEASGRPEKFFNMNFTDPHHDLLVEVMWNPKTSESTKRAAIQWARMLKMVPIVVKKEIMGYVFNRIWRAVKREALYVVDIGAAGHEDIDRAWMLAFGTPYGPFGLMDLVGLDSIQAVETRYFEASGDPRDRPPQILRTMVGEGHLGVKTGQGFYKYPNPVYKQLGWLRKEPPWDGESI